MSFFVNQIVDGSEISYSLTGAGYTVLVLIILALILLASYTSGTKNKISTKHLVFCAMAMALAMITSVIKLFDAPMGGSVTLCSMLFMTLIGYWYGLKTGLMTSAAYGILQLVTNPYIISFPQMITDYLLAFGALGLSGLFSKSKNGLIKGYLAGVLGRYFFSFLSGLIFFAIYAEGSGMSAPVYSLVYNGFYLGLEALITVIIIAVPSVNNALKRVKQIAL